TAMCLIVLFIPWEDERSEAFRSGSGEFSDIPHLPGRNVMIHQGGRGRSAAGQRLVRAVWAIAG
ncbi:hypothetical protein, partial [Streptomyces clavuligerus]|uniref:hypothetical protein n=1 Tax=Streptomyces clavuligerus TaxID=1901 RepID=UPI001E35064E